MAIVVASMMFIVLSGVGVLIFVFALHVSASSPRFRASVRRWLFAVAVQVYAVRRAAHQRLRPVAAKTAQRLRPVAVKMEQRLQPVAVKMEQRFRARAEPDVEQRLQPVAVKIEQRLRPVAAKIEQRLRVRREPDVEQVPAQSSQ